MNKSLQISKLKKLLGTNADLFDFKAQVDSKLSYSENKRIITSKLKKRMLLAAKPKKKKINSSKLVLKALDLNSRRKKRCRNLDGSLRAKKTFKARDLNKKQFIKWKRNKSHYDIEGVDSVGTYFKKKDITKTQAKKILASLDFDDLI